MKRIARYGLMLTAIAALVGPPAAWASCPFETQIVGHTFGGKIVNCPDALPIEAYVWELSNPAGTSSPPNPGGNSNGQNFICRHDGEILTDSGADCTILPGSGIDGDGQVIVFMEFGVQNATAIGCPNPGQGGDGTSPVGVQVVCNNGATANFQVGFAGGAQQYALELAGPVDGDGNPIPIAASFDNQPIITSVSAGPSPSASTVCVNVPLPTIHSDCDGTAAGAGSTCPSAGSRPAPERGTLMTTNGPCAGNPDLRVATWTATTVQPDAAGNACNTFNPPAGSCAFLGTQGRFGGINTGGISGYTAIGGPQASADKVKIDSATTANGKVKVAFSTTNETSIVGFNVYSDGAKLNPGLIASKGVGNNAYAFEIGRGALKGGKSVVVEAVKKDGTVEKTAPVSLK